MGKLHHNNLTYFTHFVLSFSFLNYAWSLNGRNVTISICDRSGGALFLLSVLGSRMEKPDCLSILGHFIQNSSSKCPAHNTQANFLLFFVFDSTRAQRAPAHTWVSGVCGHRCEIFDRKKTCRNTSDTWAGNETPWGINSQAAFTYMIQQGVSLGMLTFSCGAGLVRTSIVAQWTFSQDYLCAYQYMFENNLCEWMRCLFNKKVQKCLTNMIT